MIGFCLAAGAGTRLAPVTRTTPKALLAPAGRPLVDLALEALDRAGAAAVVVNAHHGAAQLGAHLAGRPGCGVLVEPVLAGTGGGLAAARHAGLLDADLALVTCADVVVDPEDLTALAGLAERTGAAAVVGLVPARRDPWPLRLERGRVTPDPAGTWASAGVYALRPALLDAVPPVRSDLTEVLLGPLARSGEALGLPLDHAWADAGTLRRFLDLSARLLAGCWPYRLPPGRLLAGDGRGGPVLLVEGASLDPRATAVGPLVLDAGSAAGPGALLTRAVVGAGAQVGAGARVTGSLLGPGARLEPGETAAAALVAGAVPVASPGTGVRSSPARA